MYIQRLFLSLFLVVIVHCYSFSQIVVSDPGDLQDLVNASSGGETFVVSAGTYNDIEGSFTAVASESSPIIIKAETVGGVTLTGDSHFSFKKAAHITLEGFVFDCQGESTLIKMEGANNIRISRNVFELATTEPIKWVYIGGVWDDHTFLYESHHNRVDHNVFQNKTTPGHYITIDGTSNADKTDSRQSQYDRIDHNYFKNNAPRAVNEQESIRVGWSQMSKSSGFTTVEYNRFEDCDGDPEIVSIKSCDNIVRHNTFYRCHGTLSFRHGNRSRAEGNYFFGGGKANASFGTSTIHTGGIRIYGTDHVIVNNYLEGLYGTIWDAPIALTQGDAIEGNSTNYTKHFRAERVTIAFNTLVNNRYGIEIGYDKPGSNPYNTKLKDITIANNLVMGSENSLVSYINGNDQESEITWMNNIMFPTGDASLTSDGSTFESTEVDVQDPKLTFDGDLWRTTSTSPLVADAVSSLGVDEDMDGQERPAMSNAGADHHSSAGVRFHPMEIDDVGPYAYEGEIVIDDYLSVVGELEFEAPSGSKILTVSSNIDWSIMTNDSWIILGAQTGSGSGSVNVMVTENTLESSRSGLITVSGGGITRDVFVFQSGVSTNNGDDRIPVIGVSASTFQDPNVPGNAYDEDPGTRWSGEGVGANITFELDGLYDVDELKISFLSGDSRFTYFEIEVSTNGVDFAPVASGLSNSGTTNDVEDFMVDAEAKYVRIIGGGNSVNEWNSITEVAFYGTEATITGVNPILINDVFTAFPNPVKAELTIQSKAGELIESLELISVNGLGGFAHVINEVTAILDVSRLIGGVYFLKVKTESNTGVQQIIVQD